MRYVVGAFALAICMSGSARAEEQIVCPIEVAINEVNAAGEVIRSYAVGAFAVSKVGDREWELFVNGQSAVRVMADAPDCSAWNATVEN